jgi:16S rRNA (cytidine1402-2'-O)-methyltransferase
MTSSPAILETCAPLSLTLTASVDVTPPRQFGIFSVSSYLTGKDNDIQPAVGPEAPPVTQAGPAVRLMIAMEKPSEDPDPVEPGAAGAAAGRYVLMGQAVQAPALAPGLHVVATPIGNLRDITLRALETLAAADLIACEDTRVTRKLVAHYGVATPLTPYHEHNAAQARPKILARLAAGGAVALVSDAGTPLISDPGFKLVRAARAAGHAVTALPGASAVLAALTVSGLPTDRFVFEGFLPPREGQRRKRIEEIKSIAATLVLFETGPRIAAALADLAAGLGPREAAVCRELTKLYEEVRHGDLESLAAEYAAGAEPRGEIVIVIAPRATPASDAPDLDALLRQALARVSVKEAVGEIAAVTGRPRREVYQRALTLSQGSDNE